MVCAKFRVRPSSTTCIGLVRRRRRNFLLEVGLRLLQGLDCASLLGNRQKEIFPKTRCMYILQL
jgi:hypothetical protein